MMSKDSTEMAPNVDRKELALSISKLFQLQDNDERKVLQEQITGLRK